MAHASPPTGTESGPSSADRVWLADRQVDLMTGEVLRAGDVLGRLTTKEKDLLRYLVGRVNQDVPRVDLLTDVWGYAATAKTRAVDFTVRRLRQKIEAKPDEPAHVCTIHGVGYRFDPGEAVESSPAQAVEGVHGSPVTVSGPAPFPDAVVRIRRALERGVRLITLVSQLDDVGLQTALHVAAAEPDGAVVLRGGVSELSTLAGVADGDVGALCHALRMRTPPLVVFRIEADHPVTPFAQLLRAVPHLKLVICASRRLAIAGEQVLTLRSADLDEGSDLSELDATWAGLTEPLRDAWADLSACAGSIDLEGAEDLLGAAAVDHLDALQDVGLMTLEPGPDGLRFRLRAPARRYGLQRLGQGAAARRQHRRRYVLEAHGVVVRSLGFEVLPSLAGESEELVALWSDEDASPRARTLAAVLLAALGEDPAAAVARLDASPDSGKPDELTLTLQLLKSRICLDVGHAKRSLEAAQVALGVADGLGHTEGRAAAGVALSMALARLGRFSESAEAATGAGRSDPQRRASGLRALQVLGGVWFEMGERAAAEEALRDGVHHARLRRLDVEQAQGQIALGNVLRHRKQLAACRQAYAIAERVLADVSGAAGAHVRQRLVLEYAMLSLETGDSAGAALALVPLALDLDERGVTREAGEAWLGVATARWASGDLDGATEAFEAARTRFESVEDALYSGLTLAWFGATAARSGATSMAQEWLAQARAVLTPLGLERAQQVLDACQLHLDYSLGKDISSAAAWRASVENDPNAWGDVRLALRLLPAPKEAS